MEERAKRICDLAEKAANAKDPESVLRTLTELEHEVDEFMAMNVERALASGRTFADVARVLDISRQAAHRRYRHLAPAAAPKRPRRLVATDDARAAMRLAREQAIATGAPPGSEHVLLGILGTDTGAARALHAEGVTLEAAQACARAAEDGAQTDGDTTSSLRRILRQAGQVALARGDEHLGSDQLLLAALGDRDGGATRTLAALGVTPAAIRTRLGC